MVEIKEIKKKRLVYEMKEYLSSLKKDGDYGIYNYYHAASSYSIIDVYHNQRDIVVSPDVPEHFELHSWLFFQTIKDFLGVSDYTISWMRFYDIEDED